MAKPQKIRMKSPDGQPWDAESEVEAFELMAHGYTRVDDGEQAPPADGAPKPSKP